MQQIVIQATKTKHKPTFSEEWYQMDEKKNTPFAAISTGTANFKLLFSQNGESHNLFHRSTHFPSATKSNANVINVTPFRTHKTSFTLSL